jgi:hypothetical protein
MNEILPLVPPLPVLGLGIFKVFARAVGTGRQGAECTHTLYFHRRKFRPRFFGTDTKVENRRVRSQMFTGFMV